MSRRLDPRTSDLVIVAATLSFGAGAIHAFVVDDHLHESIAFGVFFIAAAIFQIGWGLEVIRKPGERLLLAGALVNALIVAVWIASRTIGLPVGPEAWTPEAVGLADAVSTLFEVGVAAFAAVAATSRTRLELVRPLLGRTLPAIAAGVVAGVTYVALSVGHHH